MTLGVAFGIAIGDLLVSVIGSGAWQISLVVVDRDGRRDPGRRRRDPGQPVGGVRDPPRRVRAGRRRWCPRGMFDALVGGAVGLLVVIAIPRHPLRIADAALEPGLRRPGRRARRHRASRSSARPRRGRAALDRSRALDKPLGDAARTRWRSRSRRRASRPSGGARASRRGRRDRCRAMSTGPCATRRVLARAVIRAIDLKPSIPAETIAAVRSLATGTRLARSALRHRGDQPPRSRRCWPRPSSAATPGGSTTGSPSRRSSRRCARSRSTCCARSAPTTTTPSATSGGPAAALSARQHPAARSRASRIARAARSARVESAAPAASVGSPATASASASSCAASAPWIASPGGPGTPAQAAPVADLQLAGVLEPDQDRTLGRRPPRCGRCRRSRTRGAGRS